MWTSDEDAASYLRQVLGVPAYWATGADRYRPTASLAAIRAAFEHDAESVVLSWLPA